MKPSLLVCLDSPSSIILLFYMPLCRSFSQIAPVIALVIAVVKCSESDGGNHSLSLSRLLTSHEEEAVAPCIGPKSRQTLARCRQTSRSQPGPMPCRTSRESLLSETPGLQSDELDSLGTDADI